MHTLRLRVSFALLTAAACGEEELTVPDCEELAITGADGEPDPCDVQACDAAFGDGCTDCSVNHSYPPQYVADDGTTYDVYDVCPDWVDPGV